MVLPLAFSIPEIPVQVINEPWFKDSGVSLSILRTDLVHPVISGNKWFKLKYNLLRARQQGKTTLLSFGGVWSNHLHALAEAGKQYGFSTIGLVRGEIPEPLNACLRDTEQAGMQLVSMSREAYRHKHELNTLKDLETQFGDFYLIPEGGANREGALGCAEIPSLYNEFNYDLICLACGTGTTLTGLISSSTVPVLGFQVLKGASYLKNQVTSQLQEFALTPTCDWTINTDFHCGGYAKTSVKLMHFLADFEARHGVPLEPVYSAKLLYGIYELSKKRDFFPQNCSILVVHGGGLQGCRGFN